MFFNVKTKFNKEATNSTISLTILDSREKTSTIYKLTYNLTFYEANKLYMALQNANNRLLAAEESNINSQKENSDL